MIVLFIYLAIALGFSFLCSIAEAVLLSVTTAYVTVLEQENKPSAPLWVALKKDMDAPLSAILSLNTIAHTIGAAGVGAQATVVFGNGYLGITSAVLTLLILVFSEIIPKTLGSYYWRQLAPSIAYLLNYLIKILFPLVWLSKRLTRSFTAEPTLEGFSREEFAAMAQLGEAEGQLSSAEAQILNNLFKLSVLNVDDVHTPSMVVFRLPSSASVDYYFNKHKDSRFSRIPIYEEDSDHISGFVLRADLLMAKSRGNGDTLLKNYQRQITAVLDKLSLLSCFEVFIKNNAQIMHVVDEYGSIKGVITMEDIFETLVGMEIVDESDHTDDMRKFARRRWRKRASEMGLELDGF